MNESGESVPGGSFMLVKNIKKVRDRREASEKMRKAEIKKVAEDIVVERGRMLSAATEREIKKKTGRPVKDIVPQVN